jgi:hypothetical protein
MKAEPQGKNAMKKSLAFILSICLVLSLCACGAGNSGTSSPVVSVTMQDLSQSCYADDGSTLLFKYSDKLPAVTVSGNEAATTAINNTLKKVSSDYAAGSGEDGIDALLAAAKAQYADDPSMFADSGMSYCMERTADVARGDKTVLSIVYTAYSFTGGVHGITSSFGENLNTATGTELKLADIASDSDAFTKFCADYIVELTKGSDYSDIIFNDDYKSTVSSAVVADGSWYFSGDGVVFIADQYTLAAYAAGAFRFTVPYSKLTGLLKDEYMPASHSGKAGDMTIALTDNEIGDSTVGSIAIDKDGQKFTLSAKGDIFDVKLSAIEFSEGADDFIENGAYLYFSALADGQSIGVQSVIPEGMPNLMVSWRNADGTASRRLISQSGKDGSMLLIEYGAQHDLKAVEITGSLPYSADPDGDDTDESIKLAANPSADSGDSQYALQITDGTVSAQAQTDVISDCSLWLVDVDGDGNQEILLSGNVMSDDYVTYCWQYAGGALTPIKFAAGSEDGAEAADTFDGWIENIGSDGILMARSCSILGTYKGVCSFEYSDGALHPSGGSVWSFTGDPVWLTVKTALPVTLSGGGSASLPAGTQIRLTATDGESWVGYTDKNGGEGTIQVESGGDYWGWNINGAADTTYFESLPYAG